MHHSFYFSITTKYHSTAMEPEAHCVLSQLRSSTKAFRLAKSQVILLNRKLKLKQARCDKTSAPKRLSSPNSQQLELDLMKNVKNYFAEIMSKKCEQIESLQAKLQELTGGNALEFIQSNKAKDHS